MCSVMETEEFLNPPEEFDFPFPPYSIQNEFMHTLFNVLEKKQLGIFESPTGTGKSLSIICGALKWLKDHEKSSGEKLCIEIESLQKKKEELESISTDWLNSQAEAINVTKQINLLKLKQKAIIEYHKKIQDLKSKQQIGLKKQWKKRSNNVIFTKNYHEELVETVDNVKEFIINDEECTNSEDSDNDEEGKENLFEKIKILISSRTHSQLAQLAKEIIKSPFGRDTRAVTLASRQSYCINPAVNCLKNGALINERCIDMQKKKKCVAVEDSSGKIVKRRKVAECSCSYYKETAVTDLKDQALLEICDVEDLVTLGEQIKACPYYASRKAAEDAEVVLVPYNTLLHKGTRDANGIKLKNNVIIIDEAHNLLESLSQMYCSSVNLEQLELTLQQLKNYKQRFSSYFSAQNLLSINQLTYIVNKLQAFLETRLDSKPEEMKACAFTVQEFVVSVGIDNFNIYKLLKFSDSSRIGQKLHNYFQTHLSILAKKEPEKKNLHGLHKFLVDMKRDKSTGIPEETESESKSRNNFGNPFLVFLQFLESLTCSYEDGRVIMNQSQEKSQCKFSFLLLNPAARFKDIVSEARAVVVAGGTMKPLSEFRDRLYIGAGASPDRIVYFSCDHVIPKQNILPLIVTKGRDNVNFLFNFENRLKMGNVLKDVLLEACKKVPGGIVVFFPSYKYESWVWDQVKNISFGRPVFREPQDAASVDSILESYAIAIKKSGSTGALLLSIVGGKLSEGLNFSDDLGRCVIVVGLPYSNINSPELKEKMLYLDRKHGNNAGKIFYEATCTKAVNQCIGRAVRHKDDYAAMILLDVRYNRPSIKESLPEWIKRSLQTCNFNEAFSCIDQFFEKRRNQ